MPGDKRQIKQNMESLFPGWSFNDRFGETYLESKTATLNDGTEFLKILLNEGKGMQLGGKVSTRVKRKRRRQTKKNLSSRRKSYTQFTKRNTRRRKRNKNIS